jgi:hypothetical protein
VAPWHRPPFFCFTFFLCVSLVSDGVWCVAFLVWCVVVHNIYGAADEPVWENLLDDA